MTGLTDDMRARRHTMQELAQYQRIPPQARVEQAKAHVARLMQPGSRSRAIFDEWRIELDMDVVHIKTRQFNPEFLVGAGGRRFTYNLSDADWTRSLKTVKLLNPMPLREWVIVFPDQGEAKTLAFNFYESVKRVATACGMPVADPLV